MRLSQTLLLASGYLLAFCNAAFIVERDDSVPECAVRPSHPYIHEL